MFDQGSVQQELEDQGGKVVMEEEGMVNKEVRQEVEDVAQEQNFTRSAELSPGLCLIQ